MRIFKTTIARFELMAVGVFTLSSVVAAVNANAQTLIPQSQPPSQTQAIERPHAAGVDVQGFLKKARSGDARAQVKMGDLHMQGAGVLHNYSLAASWYRKAADGGNAKAQYKLGLMYLRAECVALSYVDAITWVGKAARGGEADAFQPLYHHHPSVSPDPAGVRTWPLSGARLNQTRGLDT